MIIKNESLNFGFINNQILKKYQKIYLVTFKIKMNL